MNQEKERSGNKMAALATPKKNSYVVKKSCVSKIVNSKTPHTANGIATHNK